MSRLLGIRARLAALLLTAVACAALVIYFHNGRCFACVEGGEPEQQCAYHNGPCTKADATVEYDECRT